MTTRPHGHGPDPSPTGAPPSGVSGSATSVAIGSATTVASGSATAGGAALIAARLDRIPPNRFHLRLAAVLGTGTFFDGFDAISVAVVLAAIVGHFHLSIGTAGLIISAGYLGQFVGALVVGALSERIGRRAAFALCLICFGLLSLLAALSWSSTSLLVCRLVQGVGLGAEVPVAATLMNEYLSTRRRGRVGMFYQSLYGWGLFFPPLVALLLVAAVGPAEAWRYLFAVGAIPAAVGLYAWFRLPESARWLAGRGRLAEADALVGRVESEARRRGHLLAEPVPVAVAPSARFQPGELLRGGYRGRTVMLWSAWFLGSFINYGCSVWLPTLYVRLGGATPTVALVLTACVGALSVLCVLVAALVIDRFGRRRLLIAGFTLMLVGSVIGTLGVGGFGWARLPVLIVAGAVVGIGAPLVLGPLWIYTAELYPTRMRGWGSSVASGMKNAASI
ncbi:MAG TPA: MFS transporter, partial [Pseudonocardia sp.]|nr:MFS transporter [Pseudonocardia sp.]